MWVHVLNSGKSDWLQYTFECTKLISRLRNYLKPFFLLEFDSEKNQNHVSLFLFPGFGISINKWLKSVTKNKLRHFLHCILGQISLDINSHRNASFCFVLVFYFYFLRLTHPKVVRHTIVKREKRHFDEHNIFVLQTSKKGKKRETNKLNTHTER